MPPANTPAVASPEARSPSRPQTPTPQRPLTPLSYLSSPAPDLASTLHTQAADAADEANVSFLRDSLESLDQPARPTQTHVDPQRDPRRVVVNDGGGGGSSSESVSAYLSRGSAEDVSRRERLQRVLARLNRLHEQPSASSAYGNRTPSPNRQSLYDWAPAYDENEQGENELEAILRELRRQQPNADPAILLALGETQLDQNRQQRESEASAAAAAATSTGDLNEAAGRRDRLRERERRRRENEWVSLRNRAVLQRARQEGAGSPSATERMLRYVMEREQRGVSEEEERARLGGWFRPNPSRRGNEEHRTPTFPRDSWLLPPPASELRERDRQERVEAFRRGYLAENVPPRLPRISSPSTATPQTHSSANPTILESALKYVSELRSCNRYEEMLSTAFDHGLATKEFFADKHDDFIMNLSEISSLPHSSWLQPGSVFEGHQHATTGGASLDTQGTASSQHVVEQINPNVRFTHLSTPSDHPPIAARLASFDATRPWLSHQFTPPTNPASSSKPQDQPHDRWPVRVIIHSINHEKMTLQGTMEAYDVPQHPSSLSILNSTDRPKAGKKSAPITTYLEGHVVDLRTHSFLTPVAPSKSKSSTQSARTGSETPSSTTLSDIIAFPGGSASTDASNWRKLPPFNTLSSDEEMARTLLSKARMASINENFVFMRWKERCFVHGRHDACSEPDRHGDQDRGHGLTISGFYYVSLRREDGAVAGLYFDPTSTPYQHLRLLGSRGGWPAFEFR